MMRLQHRRGGSLLEVALFVPILLYVLIAVGDFARYYVEASRLSEAAVRAVRQAAQGELQEPSAASIRIDSFCACPTEPAKRFACGDASCESYGEPARYVQASAEKPFAFVARYPGIPSNLTLRRSAGVRVR
jgi:hypothetical protein